MKEKMIEQMSHSQELMERMIRNHAENHQGSIDLDEVIENWTDNKQNLFKLFGEKLRIETPIQTELPGQLISSAAHDFIYQISNDERFSLATYFLNSINSKDLIENTVSESVVIMGTKVNKGMKVTRALKNFVNPKHLDEIQTKLSMLIQSFKCAGTLVLSIDPIDYLLMSENGAEDGQGWRSCHNIFDGEYKVGTLSYLQDGATIIAYVKTKDVNLFGNSDIKVSNKIWRQCIYVDEKMTYAIQSRQYPGTSTPNRSQATKAMAELLAKHNEKKYSSRLVASGCVTTIDAEYSQHYNDIGNGHMNEVRVIVPEDAYKDDRVFAQLAPAIKIGHLTKCLCGCGDYLVDGNFLDYEEYQNYDDYY